MTPCRTLAMAVALAFPAAALAAPSDADLQELRQQLKALKDSYESRIQALEKRLAEAESAPAAQPRPASVAAPAAPAAPMAAAPRRMGESSSGSGFNPEVSVILQGAMTRTSQDPTSYRIGGFTPAGAPAEVGPPRRRGFSLRETELVMTANIDPNFRGYLNLALTAANEVEVEEAYVQTLGLGNGFNAKFGRYLSGVGYLNEQHPHTWDFADAPLAYTAFFGNRLVSEGLQLKWLAPTPFYLELGLEGGRDDTFPGSGRNKGGSALGVLFARAGGDVGTDHSWRVGLSQVRTKPRERAYEDVDSLSAATSNRFTGKSRTSVLDFVWKWAPNGNPSVNNFKFQAEYFRRQEDGTLACADVDAASPSLCTGGLADAYAARQSGLYAQAVYQFMPRWRVGYRHDRLNSGTTRIGLVDAGTLSAEDFGLLKAYKPKRDAVMVDYSPSEFSRLRVQLARDKSRPDATDNQVWLQYIMSLGSHGAHKF